MPFYLITGQNRSRFHQCIADDIDGEFLVELDIAGGVLGALVAVVFHAQREDRRVGRQCIEEAERRGVDSALHPGARRPRSSRPSALAPPRVAALYRSSVLVKAGTKPTATATMND